jgi:hypothetical protein
MQKSPSDKAITARDAAQAVLDEATEYKDEVEVPLTNAAFLNSLSFTGGTVCTANTPDLCITVDPLNPVITTDWTDSAPCACSKSDAATANGEWSADFTSGNAWITHVKFLGLNDADTNYTLDNYD